jgi:CRP-like cAMP-binding protein
VVRAENGKPKQAPLTISIPAAGALLGLGRMRSYQSAREGEIPTLSFGRAKRVPIARLAEMLGVTPEEIGRRLAELAETER